MIKSLLLFLAFLIIVPFTLQAQTAGELRLETSFWTGPKFYYKGNKITSNGAEALMKSNYEALQLLRQGNKQANGATVVSAIGGFLIGWPIGAAIAGGDPVWELAAVGAGITIISIVIYSSATKKMERSVELYNEGLSNVFLTSPSAEIRLLLKPTEVGFTLAF